MPKVGTIVCHQWAALLVSEKPFGKERLSQFLPPCASVKSFADVMFFPFFLPWAPVHAVLCTLQDEVLAKEAVEGLHLFIREQDSNYELRSFRLDAIHEVSWQVFPGNYGNINALLDDLSAWSVNVLRERQDDEGGASCTFSLADSSDESMEAVLEAVGKWALTRPDPKEVEHRSVLVCSESHDLCPVRHSRQQDREEALRSIARDAPVVSRPAI